MKRSFGIKSRKERDFEKNSNKNTKAVGLKVSPNFKKEIDRLIELGGFESMAEFLRVCMGINKQLMNFAEKGFTEIVVHNPETKERRFVQLQHLNKIKDKNIMSPFQTKGNRVRFIHQYPGTFSETV